MEISLYLAAAILVLLAVGIVAYIVYTVIFSVRYRFCDLCGYAHYVNEHPRTRKG